jgi:hypothetical protein
MLSSWTKYFAFLYAALFLACFFDRPNLVVEALTSPFYEHWMVMFGQAILFSIFEKSNKEQFVMIQTQINSRRMLNLLINKMESACAIIRPDGTLIFYNDLFPDLFSSKDDCLPENILRLLDETSVAKI